jgi:segregation and condensation protein B
MESEKMSRPPEHEQSHEQNDLSGAPLLTARLEALLYVTDEPLPTRRLAEALGGDVPLESIQESLEAMQAELLENPERGLQLLELAGGWQLSTRPEVIDDVERLLNRRKSRTLGQAALETLAVVAYRQPVTRAEIENIRGVSVESPLHTLLERRLVRLAGRKDVPGRPYLYRTTKEFLKHFGLASLNDLPDIEEFKREQERLACEAEEERARQEAEETKVAEAEQESVDEQAG